MSLELMCRDSVPWLREHKDVGSIVTSLPDVHELKIELEEYESWFIDAASECMNSTSEKACTIFYQTDRRFKGQLVSKSYLLFKAAQRVEGLRCLFHKIVLRHEIGAVDLYRPGFSHLIAFSRKMKAGAPTADVMRAGKFLHPYGAGIESARFAVEFARRADERIVDPFCGFGTFILVANALDMRATGIDIDKHRIAICSSAQFRISL